MTVPATAILGFILILILQSIVIVILFSMVRDYTRFDGGPDGDGGEPHPIPEKDNVYKFKKRKKAA